MAALKWLLCGYGYDLTAQDVANALNHTLEAARNEGSEAGTMRSIQQLIEQHPGADRAIVALMRRKLDDATKSSAC